VRHCFVSKLKWRSELERERENGNEREVKDRERERERKVSSGTGVARVPKTPRERKTVIPWSIGGRK